MKGYWFFLLIAELLQPAPGVPARGACGLLTAVDIQRVQAASVKEAKPLTEQRKGLRFAQCVYATTDFAHSVSVTLISASSRRAIETYWEDTFSEREERRETKASKEEELPPRRMPRLGNEAFWTGDARAGALYVLGDAAILRISVGGVADETERIRRSRLLATTALRRLN